MGQGKSVKSLKRIKIIFFKKSKHSVKDEAMGKIT